MDMPQKCILGVRNDVHFRLLAPTKGSKTASIQARHSRACRLARRWTTFAAAAPGRGCSCKPGPMYHVVTRVGGRLVREPVGHNRKEAERRLRFVEVEMDQATYAPPENVAFAEWADRWLEGLRREETTRRT